MVSALDGGLPRHPPYGQPSRGRFPLSELRNWIRLAKLESPRKAIALVDHFGSPEEVFHAKLEHLAEVDGISLKAAEKFCAVASQSVDAELEALDKINGHIITYRDGNYPVNLRQIYDPPVVLFVRGELLETDRFAIGVVGTRKPSEYGKSMGFKISRDLAQRGLSVMSGGARGIDTVAHTGALQAGRTIAVLGCGVDVPYPYENRGLFGKIVENGAIISEFVPGTKPDMWRFPVRNRLISGLSLGILVVESGLTGGAMITATIAGEQGRDVWALPGTTDNSASQGPHSLIKDGAKLVECAEDILRDLGIEADTAGKKQNPLPDNLTPDQKAVVGVLTLHPKHVDEIIVECKLTPALASSALTLLEMLGLIRRVPGNAYVRAV